MNSLPKSNTVNFQVLDDNFGSSDDSEQNYQYFDDALWQKPQMNESIPDLIPMFQSIPNLGLSNSPTESKDSLNDFSITDSEYLLDNSNPTSCPNATIMNGFACGGLPNGMAYGNNIIEPIECVVVNAAHLDQFPKPASPYSAALPCIFSWFDAHNAFPSEYPNTVQNYFKSAYNLIRQHLRFFFSIAPSQERLNNLAAVRREVPSGRILFHYIGYGFPDITKKNIWCSDRRSRNFEPFKLETLFESLQPQTWYIFDCNNAGVVIPEFKATAERFALQDRQHKQQMKEQQKQEAHENNEYNCPNYMYDMNEPELDWHGWFCLCATSPDQELPGDPFLPRDFLTSTLLTPIRMAVICHMLQHYRLNLVNPSFPLGAPCSHLWDEKSADAAKLPLALTAITDGIAADVLPPDVYQKIFRSEHLSSVLFRHFLLAQYLLRPYRVTPQSYPEIPDLSMHPLWKQWAMLLDTAICAASVPRSPFNVDLFSRDATSFQVLMQSGQFDLIRPYHLTLLFHSLSTDPLNEQSIHLLSQYASDERSSPSMLTAAAVFSPLFSCLMVREPKSSVFYPLCYLVLYLLYYNPVFTNDIVKDIDASHFPTIAFNKELPEKTRIISAALVANLVVSHEKFQQICTSTEYLSLVRNEISICSPSLALWLMLSVRRAFNLYSPDPAVFTENALHLQCSICTSSQSQFERAAALSVLTCFLRPFECKCNAQLLFMSLFSSVKDASYLVRFHLVLLLKKFVMSFDSFSDSVNHVLPLSFDSYDNLLNSIYDIKNEDMEELDIFRQIDLLLKSDKASGSAYAILISLLNFLSFDPHPSVSQLSKTVLSFVSKQRAAFESSMNDDNDSAPNLSMSSLSSKSLNTDQYIVSYGDDEFEAEHLSFANLDQNESLHQISLRSLISHHSETKHCDNCQKVEIVKNTELNTLRFRLCDEALYYSDFYIDNNHFVYVFAGQSFVYFGNSNQDEVTKFDLENRTMASIKIIDKETVIGTTTDGCLFVWNPQNKYPSIIFRVDTRKEEAERIFVIPSNDDTVITITTNGYITEWDLSNQMMITESSLNMSILKLACNTTNQFVILNDNNELYLVHKQEFTNDMEKIELNDNNQNSINDIFFQNNTLFVVYSDGVIEQKSLDASTKEKQWKYVHSNKSYHGNAAVSDNGNVILVPETNQVQMLSLNSNEIKIDNLEIKNLSACTIHNNKSGVGIDCLIGDESGNVYMYLNYQMKA